MLVNMKEMLAEAQKAQYGGSGITSSVKIMKQREL
jgi:hypothetical protein